MGWGHPVEVPVARALDPARVAVIAAPRAGPVPALVVVPVEPPPRQPTPLGVTPITARVRGHLARGHPSLAPVGLHLNPGACCRIHASMRLCRTY
jgi:hypothetical protein